MVTEPVHLNASYDASANEVTLIPSAGTTGEPQFYVTDFGDAIQVQDRQLNTILLHSVTRQQAVILFANLLNDKLVAEE